MKKIYRITINIFIAVLILGLLIGTGIYFMTRPRYISQSKSGDGKYTVYFIETESPMFFGSSEVRILLKSGDKEQYEFNTDIANDGKFLYDSNWEVHWQDKGVKVILKGEEQGDEVIDITFMKTNGKF